MALTRKFLKALGVEDDKIEEIITAHSETVTALKDQITQAEAGAESLAAVTKERDALRTQYEALQKTSGDAAKMQAEFDAYKAQADADKQNAVKVAAIKAALKAENCNESVIDLLIPADLSAIELDGDRLKNPDAVVKPIRESRPGVFGKVETGGTPPMTPPSGGKSQAELDDMSDEQYYAAQKAKG